MRLCVYCHEKVERLLQHYAATTTAEHPAFVISQAKADLKALRERHKSVLQPGGAAAND